MTGSTARPAPVADGGLAPVLDLGAHRAARDARWRDAARAPVRHLPESFLSAMQGSWGEALRPAVDSAAR